MKKSLNSQPTQKFMDGEDSKPVCPKCLITSEKTVIFIMANRIINVKIVGDSLFREAKKIYISNFLQNLVDKLLLERISLAGICRVIGISGTWLQEYVNAKYAKVSRKIKVSAKTPGNAINVMNFGLMFTTKKINNGLGLL